MPVPVSGRTVGAGGALLMADPTSAGVGGILGMLDGLTSGGGVAPVKPTVLFWLMVDVGTPAVVSSLEGSA